MLQGIKTFLTPGSSDEPYDPHAFSNARVRSTINRFSNDDDHFGNNLANKTNTEAPAPSQPPSYDQLMQQAAANEDRTKNDAQLTVNKKDSHISGGAQYTIQEERNNAINCHKDPPSQNTMGCWMIPDSQDRFQRRSIDTIDGVPGTGTQSSEIRISEPPQQNQNSRSIGGPSRSVMSPSWNQYKPELFSNSVLDSERRKSTGVIVNSYTGKMFETFEEDVPPPNVDKEIAKESLEKTNPFLIWRQGGRDPNRVAPNKKEVCQDLPRKDDGPNVWGDQLYADRRRSELQTRVMRDIWSHRDGDHSVESVDDRRSVGYVGYQPAYRPLPYLPATQKSTLDHKGYTPIPMDQVPEGSARDKIFPRVFIRNPDLTQCPRTPAADPNNADWVEHQVLPELTVVGTNRETTGTQSIPGPIGGSPLTETGPYVLLDKEARDTLKAQMEGSFAVSNAQGEDTGGYTMVDPSTLRDTLKPATMEVSFAGRNVAGEAAQSGAYVVTDIELRDTQKSLAQKMYPTVNAESDMKGPYVILDTDARDTLKVQMETMFASANSTNQSRETGGAMYVQQDTELRDTLKGMMSQMFLTSNIDGIPGGDQAGAYVVQDTELRDTVKGMMQQMFPRGNVAGDATGNYVLIDQTARDTMKAMAETMFPGMNAANAESGTYIDFQGEVKPTNRMHYEDIPGRPAVSGEFWGNPLPLKTIKSNALEPYRGNTDINWFPSLSKVPAEAEDTSVRHIGKATQVTAREQQNRLPLPTRRSLQEPRVLSTIQVNSCDQKNIGTEPFRMITRDYYTAGQAAGGM